MSLSTILNWLSPLQHLINKPLPAVQGHPSDPLFGSGGGSQCPSPPSPHPWFPHLSHFHSQLQCLQHKTFRHKQNHRLWAPLKASSAALFWHNSYYSNQLHGRVLIIQSLMWLQNSPPTMEPEVSLLQTQQPVIGTYSEWNSVHILISCVFKVHFYILLPTPMSSR